MNVTIDPGVVTLIQSTFLDNINGAFTTVSNYAFNLLYLFAVLELALSGLAWALQRDVGWDKLFFKIIKIGLIFYIIQNYSWLLNAIISSFAKLAGVVVNNSAVAQYVFNPAKIWQYGYNIGVHLLQLASTNDLFGAAMILVCLGMGILLVFGLLGIQMIVQMVGFYLVSFGALIFLPFGAFSAGRHMMDKAIQAVLQAGVRLMTLIIIIGIAATTWDGFQLADLATKTDFNLNQPLGLFFTALLFLCLAFYLPKIVSQTIGDFSSNLFPETHTAGATAGSDTIVINANEATSGGGMSNMQAATTISLDNAGGSSSHISADATATAATIPTTTPGTHPLSSNITPQSSQATLAQASSLSKAISESTVKKIKEAVQQAMQKDPPKN